MPSWWRKAYAVLLAANHFVGSETPKHNAFDLIDEIFENLNSNSKIFEETHNFLIFIDSVIICIYLRRSQREILLERSSSHLRITKLGLGPTGVPKIVPEENYLPFSLGFGLGLRLELGLGVNFRWE